MRRIVVRIIASVLALVLVATGFALYLTRVGNPLADRRRVFAGADFALRTESLAALERALAGSELVRGTVRDEAFEAWMRTILGIDAATTAALCAELDLARDGRTEIPGPKGLLDGDVAFSAVVGDDGRDRAAASGGRLFGARDERLGPFFSRWLLTVRPEHARLAGALRTALAPAFFRRFLLPAIGNERRIRVLDGVLLVTDPAAAFGESNFRERRPNAALALTIVDDCIAVGTPAEVLALRDDAHPGPSLALPRASGAPGAITFAAERRFVAEGRLLVDSIFGPSAAETLAAVFGPGAAAAIGRIEFHGDKCEVACAVGAETKSLVEGAPGVLNVDPTALMTVATRLAPVDFFRALRRAGTVFCLRPEVAGAEALDRFQAALGEATGTNASVRVERFAAPSPRETRSDWRFSFEVPRERNDALRRAVMEMFDARPLDPSSQTTLEVYERGPGAGSAPVAAIDCEDGRWIVRSPTAPAPGASGRSGANPAWAVVSGAAIGKWLNDTAAARGDVGDTKDAEALTHARATARRIDAWVAFLVHVAPDAEITVATVDGRVDRLSIRLRPRAR